MANYNLAVSWSGKDALADSDANKVISGADFHTEFTAVKAAVNTKADINGSASEAFSATTANAGTNTTQVATTAFVTASTGAVTAAFINNLVYPVGSIYTNMAVATNPNSLLGVGTWVAYAEGRVLVGKQSSGTFDTLNENLGAETTTLSVAQLPAHTHSFTYADRGDAFGGSYAMSVTTGGNTRTTSSVGSGSAHTNLQPSVTVYMWKRTA